jgi:putative oxidoreductase
VFRNLLLDTVEQRPIWNRWKRTTPRTSEVSNLNSDQTLRAYALSLLRFIAGLCFLEHGSAKLFGFPSVAAYAAGHLSPLILAAGYIEFVGGILVCLGLLTRPAAFLMSGEMAIGYFISHAPKSVFPVVNGGDAAILYCFIFLYLAVAGGGPVALDQWLRWARTPLRG